MSLYTISENIPKPRNKFWNFFNCTDTPNPWPKHTWVLCKFSHASLHNIQHLFRGFGIFSEIVRVTLFSGHTVYTSSLQLRVAILFVWILNMAFPRVLLLAHFSFSSVLMTSTAPLSFYPSLCSLMILLFSTLVLSFPELTKVSEWFKSNKLSINHAETNFIFLTKSHRPEDTSLPPLITRRYLYNWSLFGHIS